jgi:hypothetical protein
LHSDWREVAEKCIASDKEEARPAGNTGIELVELGVLHSSLAISEEKELGCDTAPEAEWAGE